MTDVGVVCGGCNQSTVYFHACPDHHWVTWSECGHCGLTANVGPCSECGFDDRPGWLEATR